MIVLDQNLKGTKYKKLMKYLYEKSEIISFVINRNNYFYVIKDFIKHVGLENFNSFNSKELLKLLNNDAKKSLFYGEYENSDKQIEKIIKNYKKLYSELEKESINVEFVLDYINKKFEKNIIKVSHESEWINTKVVTDNLGKNEMQYYNIYYLNKSDELKEYILENDELFGWNPSKRLPEDLGFFKSDGYGFAGIISHEELMIIKLDSEEEYTEFNNMKIDNEQFYLEESDRKRFYMDLN